jgi:hypothetical protein
MLGLFAFTVGILLAILFKPTFEPVYNIYASYVAFKRNPNFKFFAIKDILLSKDAYKIFRQTVNVKPRSYMQYANYLDNSFTIQDLNSYFTYIKSIYKDSIVKISIFCLIIPGLLFYRVAFYYFSGYLLILILIVIYNKYVLQIGYNYNLFIYTSMALSHKWNQSHQPKHKR